MRKQMQQMFKMTVLGAVTALGMMTLPSAGTAQGNPFAPAVYVNSNAVTNFEIQQRMIMLRLFRTTGDLEKQAREGLIDDRLRIQAAQAQGIVLTDDQIISGEEEFAGRANLTRDEFIQALNQQGVSRETFRDFVAAGLAWRTLVRERFGPRAQVSENEVDRALSLTAQRGGAAALVTELILPANTPANAARAERVAADLKNSVTTEAGFSARARRISVSPSRVRGGRLAEPLELSTLPPQLAAIFLTLGPGEVSDPVPLQNAVALFMVREIIETDAAELEDVSVEYAQFFIPGGRSDKALNEAARIKARVDTCDDLYGVAKGLPEEQLLRDTLPVAEVPNDIALELAKLDPGEISTALTRGDALMLLMMCGRTAAVNDNLDREAVRDQLIQARVASYADGYLAELRADAIIRYP
ncbi:peptidylprolyl isomerase [Alphaproteobacteria bacterium KMM 3653]|uniref:Parvulin-like PPIase n=1 Tax=Harenicola maris TaxID=2841044 RepID=A0AAP2G7H9_9RHOB|nr:peptidylprolyl isomerase [Harenicola maris]